MTDIDDCRKAFEEAKREHKEWFPSTTDCEYAVYKSWFDEGVKAARSSIPAMDVGVLYNEITRVCLAAKVGTALASLQSADKVDIANALAPYLTKPEPAVGDDEVEREAEWQKHKAVYVDMARAAIAAMTPKQQDGGLVERIIAVIGDTINIRRQKTEIGSYEYIFNSQDIAEAIVAILPTSPANTAEQAMPLREALMWLDGWLEHPRITDINSAAKDIIRQALSGKGGV